MPGLLEHAAKHPDRLAYVLGNGKFKETYAELEQRSRRIAAWIRSLGLREGDSVAMLLGNVEQFFDFYWATQRLGLYLTLVNWHLNADEISYIVDNCDAKLLLCTHEADVTAQAIKSKTQSRTPHFYSVGGELAGYGNALEAINAFPEDVSLSDQRFGSVMVYSSGTTGYPKGIRKPLPLCDFQNADVNESQIRFIKLFGFREGDTYLCPAPLYHAAPARSCAATQVLGGTVVAMRKFDAESALQIIQDQRVSVSQWVPTHFKRLLGLPEATRLDYDLSSLRVALHAAAPCPVPIKQQMIDWWGPLITEYYAGTEGGGTIIHSEEWLARKGSIGKPWQGVEVAIVDSEGEKITGGHAEGLVYFRDSLASKFSYYKDEVKTRQAYLEDWFTLGDIGYTDDEGFLFLTDRASNMIISGGVNIYPQETENCLMSHPEVFDVAVIGVPCEEMGEQVKAVVIPANSITVEPELEERLIEHCRQNMAHYKAPRSIDFVSELPRTETGKLQKRKLKEMYSARA